MLQRALGEYQIVGPSTNIEFLKAVAAHAEFAKGEVETSFIPVSRMVTWGRAHSQTHHDELFSNKPVLGAVLAQAGLYLAAQARHDLAQNGHGPWSTLAFRRFGDAAISTHTFDEGSVTLAANPDGSFEVGAGDFTSRATVTILSPTEVIAQFDNTRAQATVIPVGHKLHVFTNSSHYILHRPQISADEGEAKTASADNLTSPMPATVIDVKVKQGDKVTSGQVLAVLESMKMEINIRAGRDGIVGKVGVGKGMSVEEGTLLVALEPDNAPQTE
jgi:3-methylcrotonyl-CoA carboxylase alpha subunit